MIDMDGSGAMSWMDARLEVREGSGTHGRGVFATGEISAGETLIVWGGRVVTAETVDARAPRFGELSLQVGDGLYLAPADRAEPADFVNHACAPNAGFAGQITLVAMRAIPRGEEVCFDYAMSETDPGYSFECRCGEARCRGLVCGEDWRRRELQSRYRGWFSSHVARRIEEAG